jgi:N6-adenosine-specific RNA methylase IME4
MKYNIIYADPPWKQLKGGKRKTRPNQGKLLDYPTLDINDIHNLLQHILTTYADKKHNIFIWTIDKFLLQSEEMMKSLGYSLHARIIWDKMNGIAPAFTLRYSHEYLLWFYKKGDMYPVDKKQRGKYRDVIQESSTTHSTKPNKAYEMIECMFPNSKKIELFSRNKRIGWDSWGNEVNNDIDFTFIQERGK